MRYLARLPTPEKRSRGIKLIEALLDQLQFYDDEWNSQMELLVRYPNWRTDNRDYAAVIKAARRIARSGIRYRTDAQWEEADWQLTSGVIETPGKPNYHAILQRAVDQIYERMMEQAPKTEDEKMEIIREFHRTRGIRPLESQERYGLAFVLGEIDREDIESRLFVKYENYLRRKNREE